MRFPLAYLRSRYLTRVAGASLLAGLAAGCSADTGRFAQDPFADPFGGQQQASAYPTRPVRARPLAPVQHVQPVRSIAAQPLPAVGSVRSQAAVHNPRLDYAQASRPIASTGSLPESPRIAPSSHGSWSAVGGSEIVARAGDSVPVLSNRYGVPASAIMTVNGLTSQQLTPGQRLIIPVFSTAAAQPAPVQTAPAMAAAPVPLTVARPSIEPRPVRTASVRLPAADDQAEAEPRPLPHRAAEPASEATASIRQAGAWHVVKPGETLTQIALAYGTTRPRLAKLNDIDEWTSVRIGQKLKVPGAAVAERDPDEAKPARKPVEAAHAVKATEVKTAEAKAVEPKVVPTKPTRLAAAAPAKPVAPAKPQKPAPVLADNDDDGADETPAAVPAKPVKGAPAKVVATKPAEKPQQVASAEPASDAPAAAKEDTASLSQPAQRNAPEFRWPVKGRVIQAFGSGSDGINIAVPEGTDIRAAENGVVAYAGSELKGYGNLVLIRHADGYVTAYAHAKDLNVKRGDSVKRGQVIATAGQTGNVTAPQVLFELRKGATPIDPRQYLSGT